MNAQLIAAIVSVLFIVGGSAIMKSRGIRNNNPGNIRDTGANWNGLDNPRNDGAYLRFVDAKYGIRALAKVLHNYQARHGINTVRGIISRWAPPSENNTESYIQHVANAARVQPNDVINVDAIMPQLVVAIITHENGSQPYGQSVIAEGIRLAGIA